MLLLGLIPLPKKLNSRDWSSYLKKKKKKKKERKSIAIHERVLFLPWKRIGNLNAKFSIKLLLGSEPVPRVRKPRRLQRVCLSLVPSSKTWWSFVLLTLGVS
jgi:hypothetical protein